MFNLNTLKSIRSFNTQSYNKVLKFYNSRKENFKRKFTLRYLFKSLLIISLVFLARNIIQSCGPLWLANLPVIISELVTLGKGFIEVIIGPTNIGDPNSSGKFPLDSKQKMTLGGGSSTNNISDKGPNGTTLYMNDAGGGSPDSPLSANSSSSELPLEVKSKDYSSEQLMSSIEESRVSNRFLSENEDVKILPASLLKPELFNTYIISPGENEEITRIKVVFNRWLNEQGELLESGPRGGGLQGGGALRAPPRLKEENIFITEL
uniref:Uncharacterized protein n=1 Tax=Morchella brunnea TaxID=1174671 RepID=A0A8K1I7S9_9PEZI|nr:hypothetical protein LK370_mgp144 [Morchella brunnea]UBU98441.1 hypothetical protein [Morchella brunnea]